MNTFMKLLSRRIDVDDKAKYITVLLVLILLLFIVSLVSLFIGSSIEVRDVLNYFLLKDVPNNVVTIIKIIRFPRIIAGIIVGGCLSLAGYILQVILNNSLASPSTIGVNAGAALFVMFGVSINSIVHTSVWAFFGSFVIVMLVLLISNVKRTSRVTIILAGISIATICNGLIDLITIYNPDTIYDKTSFYIGGLSMINMSQIIYVIPFLLIAFILLFGYRKSFSIIILGDELAYSLGLNVKKTRIIFVIIVAILTSMSTILAGLIGFVGIIVPHIVRRIFKGDVKNILVITFIFGSLFLTTADFIGRVINYPYEIPVGIVLSLIGGPYFIFLLLSSNKRRIL